VFDPVQSISEAAVERPQPTFQVLILLTKLHSGHGAAIPSAKVISTHDNVGRTPLFPCLLLIMKPS
jgi:hypothetical protein